MQLQAFGPSHDVAERALARMRELNIPATVHNFTVWTAYFSNHNDELNRTVDVLLSNKRDFTEHVCADLYGQFFNDTDPVQRYASTTLEIEEDIAEVLDHLNRAGSNADAYGTSLAEFSGVLEGGKSENLAIRVAQIASATRLMAEQNKDLKAKLEDSSNQIAELRADLENIREESLTDSLTGVGNRKHFDTALQAIVTDAMEEDKFLSLLFLDIDHFKTFNDTHGHPAGDQVLRLIGRVLRECVKGRDVPCRYGGEEFAILLPQTNLAGAMKVGEQIRKSVAGKTLVRKSSGQDLGRITISVGATQFTPGEPLASFVERADAALYTAKQAGRNKVRALTAGEDPLAATA